MREVAEKSSKNDATVVPATLSPADVLQEKMLFYHSQAQEIIVKIIDTLNADSRPRGDLLAMMYKKFSECTDIAIDCAAKLAPYRHPKLESVEVNKSITHRYVIRAPEIVKNTDDWLKSVGPIKDQSILFKNKETISDIEEVEYN